MAKTTKVNVNDAQKILNDLEAKKAGLTAVRTADEAAMAEIALAAHTGDERSKAKLETLTERALRRDLQMRSVESAIKAAAQKLVDAENAEAEAEAAKVAEELAELAQLMREAGAKADKGLRLLIQGSNELKRIIAAMQELGLGNPSAQQLQSLGRRAILGAIVDSPFACEFEHISPRERQSFAQFTSSWASAIEHNVGAKTKKEAADERAA